MVCWTITLPRLEASLLNMISLQALLLSPLLMTSYYVLDLLQAYLRCDTIGAALHSQRQDRRNLAQWETPNHLATWESTHRLRCCPRKSRTLCVPQKNIAWTPCRSEKTFAFFWLYWKLHLVAQDRSLKKFYRAFRRFWSGVCLYIGTAPFRRRDWRTRLWKFRSASRYAYQLNVQSHLTKLTWWSQCSQYCQATIIDRCFH